MVVCLVLEQQEPWFALSVDLYVDLDGAGIDLFRNIELVKSAELPQISDSDRRQIHEAYRFGASEQLSGLDIVIIGILEDFIFKLYVVDDCPECRMSAVI